MDRSLYIPPAHGVTDLKLLHDFMDEFAFADLITGLPLRITHLPVLLDRSAGENGTILGHIARQNEQIQAFDGEQDAVIVFRGPHAYISPTCYQTNPAVPTWNFAAVHASGKLRPVIERDALHTLVTRLVRKFEAPDTVYDVSQLPESYTNKMLGAIVGFEMRVEHLEGKFKLGQERIEGDRKGILQYLQHPFQERSLLDLTQSFYLRKA
ncbi:MAG TPA: FMN-binding negative transcriptional regulator [Bryobacteraceae bacterium]|nr:FMN-binding negative transcriptional regulator [Bryobacteraceae bacterium]